MSTIRDLVAKLPKNAVGPFASGEGFGGQMSVESINCAFVYEKFPNVRYPFDSFPADFIEERYSRQWDAEGGGGQQTPSYRIPKDGDFEPIALDFIMRAGIRPIAGTTLAAALLDLEQRVRNLQSMAFPRTGGRRSLGKNIREDTTSPSVVDSNGNFQSGATPSIPEAILVILGNFMVIRGFVISVNVRWTRPIEPTTVRPYGAKVVVTIQPQLTYFPSSLDIQDFGLGISPNRSLPPELVIPMNTQR